MSNGLGQGAWMTGTRYQVQLARKQQPLVVPPRLMHLLITLMLEFDLYSKNIPYKYV